MPPRARLLTLLLGLHLGACAASERSAPDAAGADAGAGDGPRVDPGGDAGAEDGGAGDAGAGPGSYAWTGRRACAGAGWAVGRLEKTTLAELGGRTFGPDTILWLDAAPASLPGAGALLVATSELPAALRAAAAAAHVPLLAWTGPGSLELEPMVGRELLVLGLTSALDPDPAAPACEVYVDDVTGLLDDGDRRALEAARAAPASRRAELRLLPKPTALCPVGQESTSVWALHRSQPALERLLPRRVRLGGEPAESPHAELDLRYRVGDAVVRERGPFSALPDARFTHDSEVLRDEWTRSGSDGRVSFALELPAYEAVQLAGLGLPLTVYGHFGARLSITYPTPREDPGALQPVTSESVDLWPCAWIAANPVQTRRIALPDMGTLEYEVEVGGPSSRTYFTAPLTRVLSARLRGVVREDVVFDGGAGVSATADHHNFSERLVLEPRRDPSISAATLDALSAQDVLAVYVAVDLGVAQPNTASAVWVLGRLGWRQLP